MIEFFFEFASPYSYLASLQLPALAARHGVPLHWRPIDLKQVWAAQGVLEPYLAIRRLKSGYIARDAKRVAAASGISLKVPPASGDPAPARLVFHALAARDPDGAVAFAQAVFRRRFEGYPTSDAADLAPLSQALSLEAIEAACADPEAASRLGAANAAAAASGCFGVPWIVCGDEPFFGQDRLHLLAASLGSASGPIRSAQTTI